MDNSNIMKVLQDMSNQELEQFYYKLVQQISSGFSDNILVIEKIETNKDNIIEICDIAERECDKRGIKLFWRRTDF